MTFSIIIPCYKVEKYIRECLDSILAQTVNDPKSPAYSPDCWEAICTDDGSPDGTGAILDEYAARDPRIRVIHQANGGLSAARNAAMAQAQGEWLYYLDSDDVIAPAALETYATMYAAHPTADLLRASMVSFSQDSKPEWPNEPLRFEATDTSGRILRRFTGGYFVCYLFRRSVYGDIPFVGLSWCEERPYFAKCIAKANCIVETAVPCYGYRIREGSITHGRMNIEEWKGCLLATQDVLNILLGSGKKVDSKIVRGSINKLLEDHLDMIYALLEKTSRAEAWKYWFAQLEELSKMERKTPWQAFVVATCRKFPLRILGIILCWCPHWLKSKGIHR